ncbi:Dolichyl-diphosphooligosaccharide--protein glycosyltransferase subunit WBP1 [Irpex rosettiformis]|uniref:Dolichyl-diphosphooligosaccharide--protein glycosyltransferase subunit WBP1 n=1 Tax=Irpex rosettiformis TaxID=378272 RepID=A0ACB8UHJ8_9APHY|nr:Dolichyl-diphosphooligosaccharide--protein glycosyltransferase subunit WBP1 [Irpex rosettiformis]
MAAWLLALLGLAISACAKSSTGNSVLVLLEPSLDKANFSTFFNGLTESGYELTFRAPRDAKPAVIEDDVAQFSHVVVFAPDTKSFAQDVTPQSLVSLLSKGTNLLLALSPKKQTIVNSLAAEFSLILPPPGTPLISHFPERDTPATVIPVKPTENPIVPTKGLLPVWFSGVPFAYSPNPLLVPILNAPSESFAADSTTDSGAEGIVEAADKGGEGLWAGSQLALVAGFQAHGDTRVLWAGGVDMFSDEFAQKESAKGQQSGNAQFVRDAAAWAFRESKVLRIDSVAHHRVNETEPRETYTTNDHVVFNTHISMFNPKTSVWEPYSGISDLQLEFTMLDPHIRTSLPPVPSNPGEYEVTFRVPDRHGVFKFIIDYKRKG